MLSALQDCLSPLPWPGKKKYEMVDGWLHYEKKARENCRREEKEKGRGKGEGFI